MLSSCYLRPFLSQHSCTAVIWLLLHKTCLFIACIIAHLNSEVANELLVASCFLKWKKISHGPGQQTVETRKEANCRGPWWKNAEGVSGLPVGADLRWFREIPVQHGFRAGLLHVGEVTALQGLCWAAPLKLSPVSSYLASLVVSALFVWHGCFGKIVMLGRKSLKSLANLKHFYSN